ncbi:YgaP family membrane protein [Kaarinaea lacus]
MTTNNTTSAAQNIDTSSRAVRLVVGMGLIAYVLTSQQTPLGLLAVLPLIAIYPVFTGIIGWDPLVAVIKQRRFMQLALQIPKIARVALATAGFAMIGSVFFTAELGNFAILALAGIYPIFLAITGYDPITALYTLDIDIATESSSNAKTATLELARTKAQTLRSLEPNKYQDIAA